MKVLDNKLCNDNKHTPKEPTEFLNYFFIQILLLIVYFNPASYLRYAKHLSECFPYENGN